MFVDYENVDSSLGRNYFFATCNSFNALHVKILILLFLSSYMRIFLKHVQGIDH